MHNAINVDKYDILPLKHIKGELFMKHTSETKSIMLARYTIQNESVSSIVADTGIPRSTLYHWISEYQKNQSAGEIRKITPPHV